MLRVSSTMCPACLHEVAPPDPGRFTHCTVCGCRDHRRLGSRSEGQPTGTHLSAPTRPAANVQAAAASPLAFLTRHVGWVRSLLTRPQPHHRRGGVPLLRTAVGSSPSRRRWGRVNLHLHPFWLWTAVVAVGFFGSVMFWTIAAGEPVDGLVVAGVVAGSVYLGVVEVLR